MLLKVGGMSACGGRNCGRSMCGIVVERLVVCACAAAGSWSCRALCMSSATDFPSAPVGLRSERAAPFVPDAWLSCCLWLPRPARESLSAKLPASLPPLDEACSSICSSSFNLSSLALANSNSICALAAALDEPDAREAEPMRKCRVCVSDTELWSCETGCSINSVVVELGPEGRS